MNPMTPQVERNIITNIINAIRIGVSGITLMFDMILGAVGITVVILFVSSLIQPIVSTTNSLTTGATPVISGGGASLLNQTGLFLAVALIMIILGLVFVGIQAARSSGKGR